MSTKASEGPLPDTPVKLTIPAGIKYWATRQPKATALLAPGMRSLTYYQLLEKVLRLVRKLNHAGLDRNDRVAVVFPNGFDLTIALLGASSCAACAPVNPALQKRELRSYLKLISATALLLPVSGTEVVRDVTSKLDTVRTQFKSYYPFQKSNYF